MTTTMKRWLGEFVVIVVGVLVALGVDDLRSARDDRQQEAYYLEMLARDLSADTAELHLLIANLDSVAIASHTLSTFMGDPRALRLSDRLAGADLEFQRAPELLYRRLGDFESSRATYDQMIAAGTLRVLRSTELQEALAHYYLSVDRHDAQEVNLVIPNLESYRIAVRKRGLIVPELRDDTTAIVRLAGDPEFRAIIRGLGAITGLLAPPRRELVTRAESALELTESN